MNVRREKLVVVFFQEEWARRRKVQFGQKIHAQCVCLYSTVRKTKRNKPLQR